MSNIYIQEPPTSGKILLKTTVGDIEIELWSKETPKACRNFVQLCMENYYDGTIFHRLVPGFIVQGGDPTGSGYGGESIYGSASFKDEYHQRLRFVRRGLVAVANSGSGDNGSQFFFTLDKCPELQNKHTIFGKVVGNTLFNMLKLAECEVDDNERPLQPHKILSSEVLSNPFDDIVPRSLPKRGERIRDESALRAAAVKGTKNLSLLSFGDEGEDEEDDGIRKKVPQKGSKSAHDLLHDDEKLSAQPAVTKDELYRAALDDEAETNEERAERERVTERVRNKLSTKAAALKASTSGDAAADDDEEPESLIWKEKRDEEKAQVLALKTEVKRLKKELLSKPKEAPVVDESDDVKNPVVSAYYEDRKKYDEQKKTLPNAKSVLREQQTLAMLEKFKTKLNAVKEGSSQSDSERLAVGASASTTPAALTREKAEDDDEVDDANEDWLVHVFSAEEETQRQARDANTKDEERYDIFDPRNEINKRRRETRKGEGGKAKRRRSRERDADAEDDRRSRRRT